MPSLRLLSAACACVAVCGLLRPSLALPTLDYGPAVVVGGYYFYEGDFYLNTVEVLEGTYKLPYLPFGLAGNSLTFSGELLYSCGGNSGGPYSADCYVLNVTSSSWKWEKEIRLPMAMSYHTATAVGTHIWFSYYNYIYDLEIASGNFKAYVPPFEVYWNHCAVANLENVFIFGVGENYNEVWKSTNQSDPSAWTMVQTLPQKRTEFACLYFGDIIFLTGGYGTENSTLIFNTNTYEVVETGHLQKGRESHGMFVMNGLPAVAGGKRADSNAYLWTMETYNLDTGVWSTINTTLQETKAYFGMTQQVIYEE